MHVVEYHNIERTSVLLNTTTYIELVYIILYYYATASPGVA